MKHLMHFAATLVLFCSLNSVYGKLVDVGCSYEYDDIISPYNSGNCDRYSPSDCNRRDANYCVAVAVVAPQMRQNDSGGSNNSGRGGMFSLTLQYLCYVVTECHIEPRNDPCYVTDLLDKRKSDLCREDGVGCYTCETLICNGVPTPLTSETKQCYQCHDAVDPGCGSGRRCRRSTNQIQHRDVVDECNHCIQDGHNNNMAFLLSSKSFFVLLTTASTTFVAMTIRN